MRHRIASSWSVLLFGLFLAVAVFSREAAAEAYRSYAKGEYEKAYELFARKAEERPQDVRAYYNKALALHRLGRYEEADQAFLEALARSRPGLENRILYNMGNNMFRYAESVASARPDLARENHEKALRYYRRALEIDRSDEDSAFNYEYTLAVMDDMERSLEQERDDRADAVPREGEDEEPAPETADEDDDRPEGPDDEDRAGEHDPEEGPEEEEPDTAPHHAEYKEDLPSRAPSEQMELPFGEDGLDRESLEFLLRLQQEEELRKRAEEREERRKHVAPDVLKDW